MRIQDILKVWPVISTKKKSISIIDFLYKNSDSESWSEKFLPWGKQKGNKKLLVGSWATMGIHKVPMQAEHKEAFVGNTNLDKNIVMLGELGGLTCEDSIPSINTDSSIQKVGFKLVSNQSLQRNC